ncbi:dephospho-CoA kinase [Desulfolucanica intricata]|uniref:dephospho-CoA kinase n=1 Tax=Desulfolucanica intricata TaxID=1285191 RepID=UPI0008352081|nr:dephospho-CoA kinase [Desulfolucanica intricata]
MITIGLTGNIASGKSMVSRQLKELGAVIIDADLVARKIVEPGSPIIYEISQAFGEKVLNSDGTLDRKKLGRIVFADPKALEKLNQITHPKIRKVIEGKIKDLKNKSGILVIDAPLLIEVGLHCMVDQVWVVLVDRDIQLQRLKIRDNLSEKEARQRIASQLPQEEKIKYADKIILNNGSPEKLRAIVNKLWKEFSLHY